MSVVDAGWIFSGTVGTGVLTARQEDGSWSAPIACGLTGVGFGFLIGIQAKELIVLLPDKASITTFLSTGVQLSGKSNMTLGVGREFQGGVGVSGTGFSTPLTFAYTKGVFASASLETAVVAPRPKVNEHFYEGKVNLIDIIEGKVKFPENKKTLWPDVVDKLQKLAEGISELPSEEEKKKAEDALHHANEAAETFHKTEEEAVVEVHAETEAAKEEVAEVKAETEAAK